MDEADRLFLITQATGGDPHALQRLIVEYHANLRGKLAHQISPSQRGQLDPDDVLQDTYVAAFKSISGLHFESVGAFYAWLERVAVSRLVDHERKSKRLKRRTSHGSSEKHSNGSNYQQLAHSLVSSDNRPSRMARRSEAVAAMLSSLARLSDDQRDAIRLRYLENLSVAEVARRLDKTQDAVNALCRRGLAALREAMGSLSQYLSRI